MPMRFLAGIAVWSALVVGASTAADETYVVKLKEAGKGTTINVERTTEMERSFTLIDARGKSLKTESESTSEKEVFWEAIQERAKNKAVSQLQRGYGEARKKADDKITPFPHEGKIVPVKKTNARYSVWSDNKGVPTEAAAKLHEEFNLSGGDRTEMYRTIIPSGSIRLNAAWKIDISAKAKELENDPEYEF